MPLLCAAALMMLASSLRSTAQSVIAEATIENPAFVSGGGLITGSFGAFYCTIGQPIVVLDSLKGRDDETTWTGFWKIQTSPPLLPSSIQELHTSGPAAQSGIVAAFPNPFMSEAQIVLSVARPATVRLTAYDLLGRAAFTMIDGHREPGTIRLTWRPEGLDAGAYVLRLAVDGIESGSCVINYFK